MEPPRVVLGVAGGIAAYKACELLRLFTESGHSVRVIPTAAALRFVGEATWAALSGQPVATEVWAEAYEVPHVTIGRSADLVVVAPATADLLARAAHGHADDLLTSTLLTARCPVVVVPAMHTEMWEHPATVANVAALRDRGVIVIDPAVGRLTGTDSGAGRLPEPEEIFFVARRVLSRAAGAPGQDASGIPATGMEASGMEASGMDASRMREQSALLPHTQRWGQDLTGRHVVVTAGGTREPLDPVRFLGNRSSGKQGYAFARTAVARGARVTLVSANVSLPDPAGVGMIRVATTEELRVATIAAAAEADAVIMAAAPADFRPAEYAGSKIKKDDAGEAMTLRLVANPDIAAELGQFKPPGQVLVAFAAETADALELARSKLIRKRADLIVVNEVGPGKVFGQETNAVTVLAADGSVTTMAEAPKEQIADDVWDLVVQRLAATS